MVRLNMMRRFVFLILPILAWGCAQKTPNPEKAPVLKKFSFISRQELQKFLTWSEGRSPLVSAHRGGPVPDFPENCLATFENTIKYTYALIECDVRISKDGNLVMMHDKTLDRTTTGKGPVSDMLFADLKQLRLKDNDGKITAYTIPTLDEVLVWAKGKTILMLDIKEGVTQVMIMEALRRHEAFSYVVPITYNASEAASFIKLDSTLILSCSIEKEEDYHRLIAYGVKPRNIVAFCGISEPNKSLYQLLHAQNIFCQLGTMGNLDRKAVARGDTVYYELLNNGADVLSTDRHVEAWSVIQHFLKDKKISDPYITFP